MVNEKIYLRPFDWKIEDGVDGENLEIRCYALDRNSQPCLVRINDFPAYAYIELPQYIGKKEKTWNSRKAKAFIDEIGKKIFKLDNKPENEIYLPNKISFYPKSRKVYYYKGNCRVPMARLEWTMLKSMWKWKSALEEPLSLSDGYVRLFMYETKIVLLQKFLTCLDMRHCQWFKIDDNPIPEDEQISTYKKEYLITAGDIDVVPQEESLLWIQKPLLASWDIETYSDKHLAMPDKYNYKHVVHMITLTFQILNDKESRERIGFILGDCDDITTLPNTTIVVCETEIDLINAFVETIHKRNPQVLMGYNIFLYDYPYLDHRLKRMNQVWQPMGALQGVRKDMINIIWKSGAFGDNNINYVPIDGCINLDLLHLVKRRHKLDDYKLDSVAKKFTGRGKLDMPAEVMFIRYECRQKAKEKLFKKYNISTYQELNDRLVSTDTWDSDIIEYKDALAKMAEVMEYAIRDTEVVIDIFEKNSAWQELMETSSIVCDTPEQLFTKGQQIKCVNKFYYSCAKRGYIFDEHDINSEGFAGGFVFEPEPGLHEGIIALDFKSMYPSIIMAYNICLSTLVPYEWNREIPDEFCHLFNIDLEVEVKKGDDDSEQGEGDDVDDNEDENNEEDVFDENNKKLEKKTIRKSFKFYKEEEGILPGIVRSLIEERDAVRKIQKKYAEETLEYSILEAKQLALKVMANSYFGALGARNGGKMPLPEGAMAITQTGRNLILMCNRRLMEEYGAKIIYNDTDSTMIKLNTKTNKETLLMGKKLEAIMNGRELKINGEIVVPKGESWFLTPIQIEFEKAMLMLCICKKKYAALIIDDKSPNADYKMENELDEDGNIIGKKLYILIRGIVLARRDNCPCLKRIYLHILKGILTGMNFYEAFCYLIDSVNEILDGKINEKEFISTRQLGASYKSDSFFMKIFSDRLKLAGKIVNAGDRLQFLVCIIDKLEALMGERMFLVDQFYESKGTLKIDYMYYIEKVLMNSIDQLMGTGFKNIISKLPTLYYRPKGKRNITTIAEPLKLLYTFIEEGKKIDHFKIVLNNKLAELEEGTLIKGFELEVIDEKIKLPKYKPKTEVPLHIIARRRDKKEIEESNKLQLVIENDSDSDIETKTERETGLKLELESDSDVNNNKEIVLIINSNKSPTKLGETNRSKRTKVIPNLKKAKYKHKMLPDDWEVNSKIVETKVLRNWKNIINEGIGIAYM